VTVGKNRRSALVASLTSPKCVVAGDQRRRQRVEPLQAVGDLGAADGAQLHLGLRRLGDIGWVYMMTNKANGILYVGVTSELARRAWEHREGLADGFTKRYGLKRLVYVERHDDIVLAIQREKLLKHWSRSWKVQLIFRDNPEWQDLYDRLL
jgi:putative endonuclease